MREWLFACMRARCRLGTAVFRVDDRIDHDPVLLVRLDFAKPYPYPLFFRAGDMLADIIRLDRNFAVAAVDQHGEPDRARPPGLEDDAERALHRLAGIDDVVDDHHRAVFQAERLGLGVLDPGPVNPLFVAADLDLAGLDFSPMIFFDLRGDAPRQPGPVGLDAEEHQAPGVLAVLDDLLAHLPDRLPDILLGHEAPLRAALVGLVAELLGLLDGIENRQLAAPEPVGDGVAERNVARAVAPRDGVADVFDLELVVAIEAAEHERAAGRGEKRLERRARGEAFGPRDAVGVGALGRERLRAPVKRLLFPRGRGLGDAAGGQQEPEQRHPDLHAVGRLLAVDAAAVR